MHVSLIDCSISSQAQPSHRTEQSKPRGRGGDFDSDEAKTRGKITKEQVQAKNRNKYKTRTDTRTTPHNQTRRQAGGLDIIGSEPSALMAPRSGEPHCTASGSLEAFTASGLWMLPSVLTFLKDLHVRPTDLGWFWVHFESVSQHISTYLNTSYNIIYIILYIYISQYDSIKSRDPINQTLPSRHLSGTMKHHDCHGCLFRPRPSLVDGFRCPFHLWNGGLTVLYTSLMWGWVEIYDFIWFPYFILFPYLGE